MIHLILSPMFFICNRVMRHRLTAVLGGSLILISADILQAQVPPRGESIGAQSTPNQSAPKAVSAAQTNSSRTFQTNAAGEVVIDFNILTSYPMELADNLINNTNQAAWADAQVNAMIPADIKSLNGKKVRIEGFMLPTSWDKAGKVDNFLLLANQISCCYGGPTRVHEFITIHLKGSSVEANMDSPIPVEGILRVGAMRENGQLVGIYRLEIKDQGKSVGS